MTQQHFYQNGQNPQRIRDQSMGIGQQFKKFGPLFVVLVAAVLIIAAFGVYHFSKFLINWAAQNESLSFINDTSVPVWIATVILVVLALGVMRYATTYVANIVKFVFKIAQSDIVTIILAVVINAVLLFLNGWITAHVVGWIDSTGVDSFYQSGSIWSVVVMFCMLACSFVWIPRLGVYGENRLGQFDDGR